MPAQCGEDQRFGIGRRHAANRAGALEFALQQRLGDGLPITHAILVGVAGAQALAVIVQQTPGQKSGRAAQAAASLHGLDRKLGLHGFEQRSLQDRRGEPAVDLSLAWLEAHATTESSALALSLAAICLAVYRRPIDHVRAAIEAQQAHTDFLGNYHLMAMALYATTTATHDAKDFRLGPPRPVEAVR